MTMRVAALAATIAACALPADAAQPQAETVTTLLAKGYAVQAAFPTQIGPGIFLQKGESLYVCFANETPSSPDLKTQYCKPVH